MHTNITMYLIMQHPRYLINEQFSVSWTNSNSIKWKTVYLLISLNDNRPNLVYDSNDFNRWIWVTLALIPTLYPGEDTGFHFLSILSSSSGFLSQRASYCLWLQWDVSNFMWWNWQSKQKDFSFLELTFWFCRLLWGQVLPLLSCSPGRAHSAVGASRSVLAR